MEICQLVQATVEVSLLSFLINCFVVSVGEIFRPHIADITQSISLNVTRANNILYSSNVISEASSDHVSTLRGVDDYDRASELTRCIQKFIKSHLNPTEYLTKVCYALFELENESLKPILNSILNELGQPLPPGIEF